MDSGTGVGDVFTVDAADKEDRKCFREEGLKERENCRGGRVETDV
jgi:hypothetical protein